MKFTPSTEIVVAEAQAAAPKKGKGARAAAAAVLSVGFAATFAVPAYAEEIASDPILYAVKTGGGAQQLTANTAAANQQPAVSVNLDLVEIQVEDEAAPAEQEVAQGDQEADSQANGDAAAASQAAAPAIPAGAGASGLLAAAYAQIGVNQDCTDMVQNALAAIGMTTRRDQGGYDLGTMDFGRFGTVVSPSEARPGDIMMRPGHVAIYAGNNTAVHGGWFGYTTAEWAGGGPSSPFEGYTIIRLP